MRSFAQSLEGAVPAAHAAALLRRVPQPIVTMRRAHAAGGGSDESHDESRGAENMSLDEQRKLAVVAALAATRADKAPEQAASPRGGGATDGRLSARQFLLASELSARVAPRLRKQREQEQLEQEVIARQAAIARGPTEPSVASLLHASLMGDSEEPRAAETDKERAAKAKVQASMMINKADVEAMLLEQKLLDEQSRLGKRELTLPANVTKDDMLRGLQERRGNVAPQFLV